MMEYKKKELNERISNISKDAPIINPQKLIQQAGQNHPSKSSSTNSRNLAMRYNNSIDSDQM